jgi:hypothetical protein
VTTRRASLDRYLTDAVLIAVLIAVEVMMAAVGWTVYDVVLHAPHALAPRIGLAVITTGLVGVPALWVYLYSISVVVTVLGTDRVDTPPGLSSPGARHQTGEASYPERTRP